MPIDLSRLVFEPAAGDSWSLEDLEGFVILVVNTASECGFTPQYTALEALHQQYHHMGLRVLAFPCDQFGHQEPGNDREIHSFCETQYKVSFPVHRKIEVNGVNTHPFFAQLKVLAPGILGSTKLKWNFTKFLIDRRGEVRKRYAPFTTPQGIEPLLRTLLNEPTPSR